MPHHPEAVAEAWRALGRQLAALRRSSGYNQASFAPRTAYSRSTIANVETGRQHVARDFWERCDAVLATGGMLAARYDEVERAAHRERVQAAKAAADRTNRLTQTTTVERAHQSRSTGLSGAARPATATAEATGGRRCGQCGGALSRYNDGLVCGPCQRSHYSTLADLRPFPAGWWDVPDVREALGRRDLSYVCRKFKELTGDSQESLGERMGFSQTKVSRLLRAVGTMENRRDLLAFADGLGIPRSQVGLVEPDPSYALSSFSERRTVPLCDQGEASDEEQVVKRRSFLVASGIAATDTALSASTRVIQALDVVTTDNADTLGIAADSLNELVGHYSQRLSVSSPAEIYNELLDVRRYAGVILPRASLTPHASDIRVAAGWFSNLLAVATSYLGDHGSAVVWCADAEQRGREVGVPDLSAWAALTRATIAYYQGYAGRSIELARKGQASAPAGTVAHAKLIAQEMRAQALLGDADRMIQAKYRAAKAMGRLPSNAATTGVFSITLSDDPPYTATSALLVNKYREAAAVTNRVIEIAYSRSAGRRGEQSSNYARALLILGLAEAGLGHVDKAVAAGHAALNSTDLVWPTLVLAGRLDRTLTRNFRDASEAGEYHTRYLEAVNSVSGTLMRGK